MTYLCAGGKKKPGGKVNYENFKVKDLSIDPVLPSLRRGMTIQGYRSIKCLLRDPA